MRGIERNRAACIIFDAIQAWCTRHFAQIGFGEGRTRRDRKALARIGCLAGLDRIFVSPRFVEIERRNIGGQYWQTGDKSEYHQAQKLYRLPLTANAMAQG